MYVKRSSSTSIVCMYVKSSSSRRICMYVCSKEERVQLFFGRSTIIVPSMFSDQLGISQSLA